MSPMFCSAFAYAMELSLATFSAAARLIGATTFALTSDIAARSGNSSPASSLSSSRVSFLYSCSLMSVPLFDVSGLGRVRIGDRVVRKDVRRHGGVDRDRDVRVHELHRRALGQFVACELAELLRGQLPILVGHSTLLS